MRSAEGPAVSRVEDFPRERHELLGERLDLLGERHDAFGPGMN